MYRDFSNESKERLIELVSEVENENWCGFTDWFGDRWLGFQSMIGQLNIQSYLNNVDEYHKNVIDKNNATKEKIENIFKEIGTVDVSGCVQFGSDDEILVVLDQYIIELSSYISPVNGKTVLKDVTSLENLMSDYNVLLSIAKEYGDSGISQDKLDLLSDYRSDAYINRILNTVVNSLPDVKIGEKVEVPLGPDLTAYYSVNSTIKGKTDLDINTVLEDQKLQIKNISYSREIGGKIKISSDINSDDEGSISVSTPNSSVKMNTDGSLEESAKIVVGNNETTVKLKLGLQEFSVEESVTTKLDAGSVTTTVGIKKKNNPNFKPLNVPEPEPVELPSIELPDINWGYVAAGTLAVGLVVVGVLLAPETGGLSLALCAV